MKKIFFLIFILFLNHAYGFGKLIENIGEELNKQQSNKPNDEVQLPSRSSPNNITNTNSSKECEYLEIKLNKNEHIGCADSDDWEYINAGVGLIRGEENKKAAKKLALVNAFRKQYPYFKEITNTEFANQLLTNPNYGAIIGYEIINEKNDAIAPMGQQPNLNQAKWSYALKVKINTNIPTEKLKQFEKDMRIIYTSSNAYFIPGKTRTPANAEQAKAKALDQALIDYFQLRNSERVMLPGNKLQQNWLDKNYGLYEKYEVIDSYVDPFMKIPVVKLKVFINDYKKHPNRKVIDQDFLAASPHNPYTLEIQRGREKSIEATKIVREALGAKKSHFDTQENEANFILVGSSLGDDGVDSKAMALDDIRRAQIVETLSTNPKKNPAALALMDKGYQLDKQAINILNNAHKKLAEVKLTGNAEDNQGFANLSRLLQARGERTSVLVEAIDKYYSTINRDAAEEKQIDENLEGKALEDLFSDEPKKTQPDNNDVKKENLENKQSIIVIDDAKRKEIEALEATAKAEQDEKLRLEAEKENERIQQEALEATAKAEQDEKLRLEAEKENERIQQEALEANIQLKPNQKEENLTKNNNNDLNKKTYISEKFWKYSYSDSDKHNGEIIFKISKENSSVEKLTSNVKAYLFSSERQRSQIYSLISSTSLLRGRNFYEFMPYLSKDEAINFTKEKLIINTEQHSPLSINDWVIIVEDLTKNYKYTWKGNEINATKINIIIRREIGGSGNCSMGGMGGIKAELIYAENIERITEQTTEILGCALNSNASTHLTTKLKLIDYKQ